MVLSRCARPWPVPLGHGKVAKRIHPAEREEAGGTLSTHEWRCAREPGTDVRIARKDIAENGKGEAKGAKLFRLGERERASRRVQHHMKNLGDLREGDRSRIEIPEPLLQLLLVHHFVARLPQALDVFDVRQSSRDRGVAKFGICSGRTKLRGTDEAARPCLSFRAERGICT